MSDCLTLAAGILLAGFGGEFFLRGLLGLAGWLRIAPGIIGATVAAFATSSPELSVAITSASIGRPEISLGDALGSNVVNVAFVLGLALVIAGIPCPRDCGATFLPRNGVASRYVRDFSCLRSWLGPAHLLFRRNQLCSWHECQGEIC